MDNALLGKIDVDSTSDCFFSVEISVNFCFFLVQRVEMRFCVITHAYCCPFVAIRVL